MGNSRDDFTSATKELLANRVGRRDVYKRQINDGKGIDDLCNAGLYGKAKVPVSYTHLGCTIVVRKFGVLRVDNRT